MMSLATVLIMIGLIPLVQLLFSFDAAGNQLLAATMILQSLALPFLFYAMNVTFITRAGGYTKAPILITNIPYLFIKAPLVALFAFVFPGVVETSPGLQAVFAFFGLPADLVIFIFLIDRFVEVLRAAIAFIVYHKAQWQTDLTKQTSRELKQTPSAA
jgi:Na+-driven multidrug efflux pump